MSEILPTIYVARHGETAWSITGQHTGLTDLPLTERGEHNASRLKDRLKDLDFKQVYVSPLRRARRTCELAGFSAVAAIDPDLVEWDYGQYEGRRSAEIHAERPDWELFRDNDPIQNDLRNCLERKFGRGYWAMQEEMSQEAGYRDYPGALQRYRSENPTDVRILSMSSFLAHYPFANRLYPGALDVFERLRSWGQTASLSDGVLVFQPRRVARSGICGVFEGHVFIYGHKDEALEDVWKRCAARDHVLVDDKLRNLTAVKKGWGDGVTAVFRRQGKFAHDRAVAANPTPDATVEHASDLLGFELLALHAASQSTKNRNPNLPRHEVTT